MIVVVLEKCPPSLRGDLTKWLQEINTGVYAGNVNARVRDQLWERICANIRSGRATMAWSARGEQGMSFRVHNTAWQPVDYDGITLMVRPDEIGAKLEGSGLRPGFSKAAKARMMQRVEAKRRDGEHLEVASVRDDAPSYVVVDVETTGLNCDADRILEIGAIKVRGGAPADEFCSLVRCDVPIPAEAAKLTGITDEMLASAGRPIEDVMKEFAEFIADERVVCHNARFDIGFLMAAAKRCGIGIMRGSKCEDTLMIARRKIKGLKSFKLVEIAKLFDLDTSGAHRAIKDCYLTHQIYEALSEKG